MSRVVDSILWDVLYEESVDGIFVIDTALRVIQANQKAEQIFGVKREELLQAWFSDESCVNLSNLVLSGFVGRCLVQLTDYENTTYSLLATLVSENVVLQFIQLEHKHPIRAQQHLLSLGRFLGDIAHAMSNPLAVLQGRVELLLHKSAQYPQDLKRHFSSMFEQCARITDQLHLIQILSKKKTFSPQPLSIQKQLRHFMKSYQGSGVLELGTNTEAHILFASVQFQVIVAQLVHVLSEKFSQPIRIRFELIEEGLDVCLSFIFDQAAQDPVLLSLADGGSFSSIKGRDVRFFLCSLLMEHQGGSLSFYAKKKSYYALLRFPLYTPKSDDNLSSLLRIMVIDDHSNLRETLSALLAKEGHHLAAVPSAEDAMELMAQSLFDVVISDIRLPGISGLELYELMSHSNPEMAKKMILISGIRQHLDQQKIPFLRKPFSKSELLRLIKKIVSPE